MSGATTGTREWGKDGSGAAAGGADAGGVAATGSRTNGGGGGEAVTAIASTTSPLMATGATTRGKAPRNWRPLRTGCSIRKYEPIAIASVAPLRSANRAGPERPVRSEREPQEQRPVVQVHAVRDQAEPDEHAVREPARDEGVGPRRDDDEPDERRVRGEAAFEEPPVVLIRRDPEEQHHEDRGERRIPEHGPASFGSRTRPAHTDDCEKRTHEQLRRSGVGAVVRAELIAGECV